jgi:hypothetical protein
MQDVGGTGCRRSLNGRAIALQPRCVGGRVVVPRAVVEAADCKFLVQLPDPESVSISSWLNRSVGESGTCSLRLGDGGGELVLVGSSRGERGFVDCVVAATTSELDLISQAQSHAWKVARAAEDSDSGDSSEEEAAPSPEALARANALVQRYHHSVVVHLYRGSLSPFTVTAGLRQALASLREAQPL